MELHAVQYSGIGRACFVFRKSRVDSMQTGYVDSSVSWVQDVGAVEVFMSNSSVPRCKRKSNIEELQTVDT
jgi:hypothetical protein